MSLELLFLMCGLLLCALVDRQIKTERRRKGLCPNCGTKAWIHLGVCRLCGERQ